ncbi:MAG TPA: hypothetical protein VJP07_02100 [Dehalococcoidia bacterium]|nr:hypothetical protein [Dehalococcoidia bacterium]
MEALSPLAVMSHKAAVEVILQDRLHGRSREHRVPALRAWREAQAVPAAGDLGVSGVRSSVAECFVDGSGLVGHDHAGRLVRGALHVPEVEVADMQPHLEALALGLLDVHAHLPRPVRAQAEVDAEHHPALGGAVVDVAAGVHQSDAVLLQQVEDGVAELFVSGEPAQVVNDEDLEEAQRGVPEQRLDGLTLGDVTGEGRLALADVLGPGGPAFPATALSQDPTLGGQGEAVLARLADVAHAQQERRGQRFAGLPSSNCLRHDAINSSFNRSQRSDSAGGRSYVAIDFGSVSTSSLTNEKRLPRTLPRSVGSLCATPSELFRCL